MFKDEDGAIAVRTARASIEKRLGKDNVEFPKTPLVFKKESGVFVTLNTYPERDLRGCIGYPEPIMPLENALKDAAVSAATRDPRFPPLHLEEMNSIVIDVTLLTPPVDIEYSSPEELVSMIVIGRDGLIAKRSYLSGLLLPQVPVEYGWSVEEFLSHTCMKAGMKPEAWRVGDVKFQKFQGRIYGEEKPGGTVREIPLE